MASTLEVEVHLGEIVPAHSGEGDLFTTSASLVHTPIYKSEYVHIYIDIYTYIYVHRERENG